MKLTVNMNFLGSQEKSFIDRQDKREVFYTETAFMPLDGTLDIFGFNVMKTLQNGSENPLLAKVAQMKPGTPYILNIELGASKDRKPFVKFLDVTQK